MGCNVVKLGVRGLKEVYEGYIGLEDYIGCKRVNLGVRGLK